MNIIGIDMARTVSDYTVMMLIKNDTDLSKIKVLDSFLIRTNDYKSTKAAIDEKINQWENKYLGSFVVNINH